MNHYYMISYHRRGFAGSSKYANNDVISISKQALECQKIMCYLDIESAHTVGHSHGGVIALQLALDFPESVSSLSLLEPALIDIYQILKSIFKSIYLLYRCMRKETR